MFEVVRRSMQLQSLVFAFARVIIGRNLEHQTSNFEPPSVRRTTLNFKPETLNLPYILSTPNPGLSEHIINPSFRINPPLTTSRAKSKLPSKSMYFVLEHANAACRAAVMLTILSSLQPQKRSMFS